MVGKHSIIAACFILVLITMAALSASAEPITHPGEIAQDQSTAVTAGAVGRPQWGFKIVPPAGWVYQEAGEIIVIGHRQVAGAILVFAHQEKDLAAVTALMREGLRESDIQLSPAGAIQPIGKNLAQADYSGAYQSQPVKALGIGTAAPGGGGAWIIALCTPEKFSPELRQAALDIARTIRYSTAPASSASGGSELQKYFVGTWMRISANSQRQVTLYPDGTFEDYSESTYSGQFRDGLGNNTGAWGTGSQNQGRGRWAVQGSREQGVMTFTKTDGTTSQSQYQVHVEKGQVYWNEYLIDGVLYGRKK